MSANINSIAYTGAEPWHGQGVKVDHYMSSAEAIQYAGLNWKVECLPSQFTYEGEVYPVPGSFHPVRMDTMVPLGTVGSRFTPVQNTEAFGIIDDICADNKARIEVAGALGMGEHVWMLARVDGEYRIGNTDDIIEPFLLCANGHDGTMALNIFLESVRVVCKNTLRLAMGQRNKEKCFVLKHTQSILNRAEEARRVLGITFKTFQEYADLASILSTKHLTTEELRGYFTSIVPDNTEAKSNARPQGVRDDLESLFVQGEGNDLPGVRGSLWAAFNAVTQYVDHHRTVRETGGNSRFEMATFGTGHAMKSLAWDNAVALVGAGS